MLCFLYRPDRAVIKSSPRLGDSTARTHEYLQALELATSPPCTHVRLTSLISSWALIVECLILLSIVPLGAFETVSTSVYLRSLDIASLGRVSLEEPLGSLPVAAPAAERPSADVGERVEYRNC